MPRKEQQPQLITDFREYLEKISYNPTVDAQEFAFFSGHLLALYQESLKSVAELYAKAEKFRADPKKQLIANLFARKGHIEEIRSIPLKALLQALKESVITKHSDEAGRKAATVLSRYKLAVPRLAEETVSFELGERSASRSLVESVIANPSIKGAFVSGPAGAGKSEFIRALTEYLWMYGITVVTIQFDDTFKAFARHYQGNPLEWNETIGKEFEKAIKDIVIMTQVQIPSYARSKFRVFFAIDLLGYPTLSLTNGLAMIQRNQAAISKGEWQLFSVIPDRRVTEFADRERSKPAEGTAPENPDKLYEKGAPGGVVLALYQMLLEQATARSHHPLLTEIDHSEKQISLENSLTDVTTVPDIEEMRLLLGYFVSTMYEAGIPLNAILPALNFFDEKRKESDAGHSL